MHVKFNDEHVPESPAIVRVLPLSQDAKKVQLIGLRDRGLDVSLPLLFLTFTFKLITLNIRTVDHSHYLTHEKQRLVVNSVQLCS